MPNYPTYWITPADWSLDTSFDQWSGFIVWASWISKVKESWWSLFVWWSYFWYNNMTSINSSSTRSMVSLLDDWSIDTTKFSWANVAWNSIVKIEKTSDWKYILATFSTTYHTNSISNYICRLNSDFSLDTTFVPWSLWWWTIWCIKVMSDWKILVWTWSNALIRLNSDWTLDNTFVWPTLNNRPIFILERSDGKYIVWWQFTTVNGGSRNNLVLLNTDWTVDTSLSSWAWYNNSWQTFWIKQADDKVILFWNLTTYSWTTVNRIVRLNTDWTIDWTFVSWTWFNGNTNCAVLQADWKVVVWWDFTTYKGVSWYTRIIRLNTDWSADWTFVTWTGFWASVSSVVVDSNERIFVWWSFTTYNSVAQPWYCIKLNSDWSKYTTFNPWVWFNGIVFSWIKTMPLSSWAILCISPNHSAYNWFENYNWQGVEAINKITLEWVLDTTFPKYKWLWWFSAWWTQLKSFDISWTKIVISWDFTKFNWVTNNGVTLINTDWTLDTSFVSWTWFWTTLSSPSFVWFAPDWWIVCIWWFTSYNWTTRNRIVKLLANWTIDWTFAYTSWFSWNMNGWYVQSNWKIITFTSFNRTYNWLNSNRLHRLNADWTIDSTFMTNIWTWPNSAVRTILELADWTIILSWFFTTWNWGSCPNAIIALNPDWTVNNSISFGTWLDVYADAIWKDGDWNIYLWWSFSTYKWSPVDRLIKISNTWTLLDSYWFTSPSQCKAIDIVWNKMYVWWIFTVYDWTPVGNIARIFI